jgi:Sulfotransferase family
MAETTPQPLFILSPPRSFSSVVCAMLGQHPQCYGLPEMHLFFADDLGHVMKGTLRHSMVNGLLRALAQLHDGEQTDESIARAREWTTTRSSWPIRKVFDHIQELVGPRMLVEKSPATTYSSEFVGRLLRTYPKANLLHLTRHPRSTGESLAKLRSQFPRLQRITGGRAKLDPERIWRVNHKVAITATADLPPGQCMRLKGEALMRNLALYLPQICEWLDLRSDAEAIEAMMHPENSPYAKPGPPAAPFGNDPSFLENPALDPERLEKLKEPRLDGELAWRPGEMFASETRQLAKQFGYQ